jgi:hypothetical protein
MYITIYFIIGFIAFCVLQACSKSKHKGGQEYDILKGFAWTSLFLWPFVALFLCVSLLLWGIAEGVKFLDAGVDRLIRRDR